MSAEVRYYSRSGHTKKLAEAIAKGACCDVQTMPAPITEKTDVLFIGSGLYAASLDKNLKSWLEDLDPAMVGKAVLFSTAMFSKRALVLMEKILKAKGIKVETATLFAKSDPDAAALKAAEEFGRKYGA